MTKKQMVAEIQVAEAKAWKEYREAWHQFGKDDSITQKRSRAWLTIFNLREALGIPALSIQSLIEKDLVPA